MTNNNKNTVQQVGNKYRIYVYVLTIQLFYTKTTAYKRGKFGLRSIALVWFQDIGPLQVKKWSVWYYNTNIKRTILCTFWFNAVN